MRGVRSVVAAMVVMGVAPASVGARSLDIDVPRTVTAQQVFSATWSGETGPQDVSVYGGFVVDAFLRSGTGRCPAVRKSGFDRRRAVGLAAQGVPLAGPLRGAAQVVAPKVAGRYRVCGYLSRPGGGSITYERVVDGPTVRVRGSRTRAVGRVADPAAGTYVAQTRSVTGGGSRVAVRVVVAGGTVTSVTVTDLQLTRCDASVTPTVPQLNTFVDVASTGASRGLGSMLRGSTVAAAMPGVAPSGTMRVDGGFASGRELRGVVTASAGDGVCSGAVAFTARR